MGTKKIRYGTFISAGLAGILAAACAGNRQGTGQTSDAGAMDEDTTLTTAGDTVIVPEGGTMGGAGEPGMDTAGYGDTTWTPGEAGVGGAAEPGMDADTSALEDTTWMPGEPGVGGAADPGMEDTATFGDTTWTPRGTRGSPGTEEGTEPRGGPGRGNDGPGGGF